MWAARAIGARNVGFRGIFNRISDRCLPCRVASQPGGTVVAGISRCEAPSASPGRPVAYSQAHNDTYDSIQVGIQDDDLRKLNASEVEANNSGSKENAEIPSACALAILTLMPLLSRCDRIISDLGSSRCRTSSTSRLGIKAACRCFVLLVNCQACHQSIQYTTTNCIVCACSGLMAVKRRVC